MRSTDYTRIRETPRGEWREKKTQKKKNTWTVVNFSAITLRDMNVVGPRSSFEIPESMTRKNITIDETTWALRTSAIKTGEKKKPTEI